MIVDTRTWKSAFQKHAAGVVLVFLGGFIAINGWKIGAGSLSAPGSGFTSVLLGLVLVGMSVGLFFVRGSSDALEEKFADQQIIWRDLATPSLILLALFAFVIALPHAGYAICTFALATLVSILNGIKPVWGLVVGTSVSAGAFLIFKLLLGVPLPA